MGCYNFVLGRTAHDFSIREKGKDVMFRSIVHAAVSSALAVLLICPVLLANDAPSTFIFDAIQNGQDVRLTLGILTQENEITLVREGDDYRKVVLKKQPLAAGVDPTPYCWDNYGNGCDDEEEWCDDCDGDGVAECWDTCLQVYFVDHLDECVYPGETTYYLYIEDNLELGEDTYSWSHWIDVEDTEAQCDYDLSEAGGDCSFAGSGPRSSPSVLAALVTLAIGELN